MSADSTETEQSAEAVSAGEAPDSRSAKPLVGGRRLGDDPFLPDEGLFWWLPRTFSLLVVAVSLMLLGGHFFGGEDTRPAAVNEQPAQSASVQQTTSAALVPAAPQVPVPRPPQGISPLHPLPAISPGHSQSASLDASRSYNARRRAFLQEGEALLRALPPEGTGGLESARDRRAIREFIQRMDTPAR